MTLEMPSSLKVTMDGYLRDGVNNHIMHHLYLGCMMFYRFDNNYNRLALYVKANINKELTRDKWEELMQDLHVFESQPHLREFRDER